MAAEDTPEADEMDAEEFQAAKDFIGGRKYAELQQEDVLRAHGLALYQPCRI